MKARKEIADYIKQKKTDRAKIRVREEAPMIMSHVMSLMIMMSLISHPVYSLYGVV